MSKKRGLPVVQDCKIFVPARDFALSRKFYMALGWNENWCTEGLCELELAGQRIFLQNFYTKEWAENFMIYLNVESAQECYEYISYLLDKEDFPGARVKPPKQEVHALVTYVYDPSGVLLHFAQTK